MALPPDLYARKKKRRYEQLVDFVGHLQGTIVTEGFMGKNMDSFEATMQELLALAKRYDEDYRKDQFMPEQPGLRSLELQTETAWKKQPIELNSAG